MPAERSSRPAPRPGRAAGLVVALLLAGVGSYYASSRPDGLEWSAEEEGFLHTARDSAAADSPLADYGVAGIGDARLSGGLAGVTGVLVTLLLAGGITLLVRRRTAPYDETAGRVPAGSD